MIQERLEKNLLAPDALTVWNTHLPYKPKQFPLENEIRKLEFSLQHAHDPATLLVDTLFLLLITVFRIVREATGVILLSPDLRHEIKNLEQYVADHHFLQSEGIRTIPQLQTKIEETRAEISALERLRTKADNQRRRADTPEKTRKAKQERAEIARQIDPLRKKLKHLERIQDKTPRVYELLSQEHQLERKAMEKQLKRTR